jgi:hypothetical protein
MGEPGGLHDRIESHSVEAFLAAETAGRNEDLDPVGGEPLPTDSCGPPHAGLLSDHNILRDDRHDYSYCTVS